MTNVISRTSLPISKVTNTRIWEKGEFEMVGDRKFWNYKIFIKRDICFIVVLIYLFPSLVSQAQHENTQIGLMGPQSSIYI